MTAVNNAVRMTVTLQEAADLIVSNPETRFLLRGEPGIGKSSLLKAITEKSGLPGVYVDVPNLDLGDVCMPIPNHETRTMQYYPNARFGLHTGKPVVICLDEFSKGMDPVKNMLHPLLEISSARLGDVPVPKGTIIFLTGNLDSDGVGDSILAHTQMRIVELEISKPTAPEWLPWANANGIHPTIRAWVERTPFALASYRDGDQAGNPYIFFPNKVQGACVTLRTLEMASNIVKNRGGYGANALMAALTGAVGSAAAHSIASFIRHFDALPKWADIMDDPTAAKMPDDSGAIAVMVFTMIDRITTSDELTKCIQYMKRTEEEWQSILCLSLARDEKRQKMAFRCAEYAQWLAKNQDLL